MDCVQPLDARCGNDIREYKKQYGQDVCLFGNIDMDILATGDRQQIPKEVTTKIETAKVGGGYICHSDHSVPPTVSWDDYRYWMELAHEVGRYH